MTKVHTSLGSHPQGRPQAYSAQMAPATRVKVHIAKPTALSRKERCSSSAELGSAASSLRHRLIDTRLVSTPAERAPLVITPAAAPVPPVATVVVAATSSPRRWVMAFRRFSDRLWTS